MKETNLQELEKRYTELGGNLHHYRLREKFTEAELLAQSEQEFEEKQIQESEQKRPEWAKTAGAWAGRGLSWVSTVFTFIFVFGGLIIGTITLMIAELAAVYEGFAVVSPAFAPLYAFSLVLFYIVVLFIEQIVIDRYGQRQGFKFSLRLFLRDFLYFIGIGDKWDVQYQDAPDEAKRVKTTVQWLTYAIVLFGLLGRLSVKLASDEYRLLAWHESLKKIALESNLQEFMGYFAMIIITFALLWSNKWVVTFIYSQFRRVTGGVVMQDFSSASMVIMSPVQRIEASRAKVLQREIMRLESGKKE